MNCEKCLRKVLGGRCPTTYQLEADRDPDLYPEIALKGQPPSPLRLDQNTNISHMGKVRQKLLYPDGFPSSGKIFAAPSKKMAEPACYCASPSQVADWAKAVSMPEYAPVFCKHQISGRKLMTLNAVALNCLGVKDTARNLQMEELIRDLNRHIRQQAAKNDVLPYEFIYHLNMGLEPPRPSHSEPCRLTDPWQNQTSKL